MRRLGIHPPKVFKLEVENLKLKASLHFSYMVEKDSRLRSLISWFQKHNVTYEGVEISCVKETAGFTWCPVDNIGSSKSSDFFPDHLHKFFLETIR